MPLFSSYRDQTNDLEDKVWLEQLVATPPPAERILSAKCSSCGEEFASEPSLFAHNFAAHPISSFYVRANERIALALTFIDATLQQLEVVPMGVADLHLMVQWAGGVAPAEQVVSSGRSVDLVTRFGPVEAGEVRLWAATDSGEHVYRIYVHDPPDLDYETLDEIIFESQMPLLEGHPSTWQRLRDVAERDLDEIERRYVLGFASYLHGCDLEAAGEFDAARHSLESAFRRLAPFASALARDTRAMLAFRMNALDLLRAGGEASPLWQAANFFDAPAKLVDTYQHGRTDVGIWIDEFQAGLLEAVRLFVKGDLRGAIAVVECLPIDLRGQPDNDLKRLVLRARLAAALGDVPAARLAYQGLRDHPLYGPEALVRS